MYNVGILPLRRADGIRTRVRSFAETYLTRLGHRAMCRLSDCRPDPPRLQNGRL